MSFVVVGSVVVEVVVVGVVVEVVGKVVVVGGDVVEVVAKVEVDLVVGSEGKVGVQVGVQGASVVVVDVELSSERITVVV